MPLRPLNRETGEPKKDSELSAGERAGIAQELKDDAANAASRRFREAQSEAGYVVPPAPLP